MKRGSAFALGCGGTLVAAIVLVVGIGIIAAPSSHHPRTQDTGAAPGLIASPSTNPTPTATPTATPVPAQTTAPPAAPTTNLCGAPSNPWGYNFCGGSPIYDAPSNFCSYFDCIESFWESTNGYLEECVDGSYSHSGGRDGACSYNGGEYRSLYG